MASSASSEHADPEALYLRCVRNQAVHEAAKYGYVEEEDGWVSMARLGGWVGGREGGWATSAPSTHTTYSSTAQTSRAKASRLGGAPVQGGFGRILWGRVCGREMQGPWGGGCVL